MFNVLLSSSKLFVIILLSFFIIFTIRQLFIRKRKFVFLYHAGLFCILFIASIGGGGVQNDGYKRLEKFIVLEKSNQLEQAKNNLQNYDSMLQIDLQEFQSSNEFINYLKDMDVDLDNAEAISLGWVFALWAEISMVMIQLLGYLLNKIKPQAYLKI